MDKRHRLALLRGLAETERAALGAYAKAQTAVNVDEVRQRLRGFREDHETRFRQIAGAIARMQEGALCGQGVPVLYTEGFIPVPGDKGTRACLEALARNEQFVYEVYSRSECRDTGEGTGAIVSACLENERGHLDFILEAVEKKVWESFIVPLR